MKIKFFGLMLLAVVMVFALASCGGGTTPTQPAGGDNYTVSFDVAGIAPITVPANTTATKPADPTKDGFTFAGWMYNGALWNFDQDIVFTDIQLTASWTAIEYDLTLNLDGGVLVNAPTKYTAAGLTLPLPTKSGYTFAGWKNATGTIVTAIPAGTTGAQTFTATWAAAADLTVDFENLKQNLHYCEPAGSDVATQFNQSYSEGGAGKRSEGTMQAVYQATVAFGGGNAEIISFMKNAKNWHEIATENENRFFRVALGGNTKYTEVTANEAYNVGIRVFTSGKINTNNNLEDDCFTIKFDFRQKNEGAFGINVYANADNNDKATGRVTLLTIGKNGELFINGDDTANGATRGVYSDGASKLSKTTIGQTNIGEWNTIEIKMVYDADAEGHFVTITLNGQVCNEGGVEYFLADDRTWVLDYNQFMFFGGENAGQLAAEAMPGYYNEYDFDNITISGSVAE